MLETYIHNILNFENFTINREDVLVNSCDDGTNLTCVVIRIRNQDSASFGRRLMGYDTSDLQQYIESNTFDNLLEALVGSDVEINGYNNNYYIQRAPPPSPPAIIFMDVNFGLENSEEVSIQLFVNTTYTLNFTSQSVDNGNEIVIIRENEQCSEVV